jgi:HNH endonuclease
MRCYFCNRSIALSQLHQHHIIPKSEGGTVTAPTHKACHIAHHSKSGHFRHWGRIGGQLAATTCRWAFTLKNIKDNPAYELHRQFYRLYYAEAV